MKSRLNSVVCSIALCLGLSPLALADNMTVVPSEEAGKNAHVINKGVKWHTQLEEAQAAAKKDGKLIFWIHMLGTMEGAT